MTTATLALTEKTSKSADRASKSFIRTAVALASLILLTDAAPVRAQQMAMATVVPQINVTVQGGDDRTQDSRGTAFLVGRDTWVTAAHVVKGCQAVYVKAGGEWRPAANVKVHGSADLAVFTARQDDRTQPLMLSGRDPSAGDFAFHVGFAKGEFTAVETRLSAQANVRLASTGGQSAGWVWSQADAKNGERKMNGVSGGPQLDASGAVQGVTISYGGGAGQALRMTTVPMSELQGFLPANVQYASANAAPIQGRSTDHAARLKANGSVTSVFCATTTSTRNLPRT
jgi:S1-C subfamily serine protease